jgi:hypothetical protein
MVLSRRWNKFWTGLTLGVVCPLIALLSVYLFGYRSAYLNLNKFLEVAVTMQALPKILSLCVLPNLAIFYLFLNKEYWYATRGVITATILFTVAVLVIKLI